MRLPLLSLISALLLVPALAQTPAEPPLASGENGRFQMTPSANGFLRLDTRTGAVSLCTVNATNAECRSAADDRAALMAEIDRLSKRNSDLELGAPRSSRPATGLPSKEEAGKAMDLAEEFLRRMMRIMRDETKDRT